MRIDLKEDEGIEPLGLSSELLYKRMHKALLTAQRSNDANTQNSALIYDRPDQHNSNGRLLVSTFNSCVLNRSVEDQKKNYVYEHAERHAIYQAARHGITINNKIMICPWFACSACARAIALSGIKVVIGLLYEPDHIHPDWVESIRIGNEILDNRGVYRYYIPPSVKFNVSLRRNGQTIYL